MGYKLVYFAFISDNFGGVEQKIIAQFDALYRLGIEIHLFLISSFIPGKTLSSEIEKRIGIETLSNSLENIKNPLARRKEKFELITSTLLKFDPNDTIIYFRYPLADFLFLSFLKRNKDFRFVTEHQDIEKIALKGLQKYFEILWGKPVRRLIPGFIGVTEEISNFARVQAHNNCHYFETIGNGIDINRYPLRIPKKDFQHNEIRILFIGGGYVIHGLDRLIKSIDLYYKNINNKFKIQLKVIGDSKQMYINKDLVKKLALSSIVSFYGNLENEKLNEFFNWAHIGVGSLAIHRKGLKLTSELKAREYCVRGLPFFCSSFDQDFDPDFPYIHKVPEGDAVFNLDLIISFALQVTLDPAHPLKMRNYAIEHLDWSVKMLKLVSFLNKINESVH